MPSYSYNSSNELTQNSLGSYTYDANGNTLTDATGKSYTWDFENRMVSAVVSGSGTVTFRYDPFGRRIQKSSWLGTTNYLYDGMNILETTDQNGNELARYAETLNVDEPLSELVSGTTTLYEQDGLGSVTSLSNSSGAPASTYTYDSYGKLTASEGSTTNPFQYAGRESDSETGIYGYRARYYSPTLGRFISEDPIRFAGGQPNLYAYVFDDPTNFIDPLGLDAWDWVQNFGDFSNGAASVLTFGLTDQVNNALGNSQFVNKCSGWHTLGTVTGIGLTTAIGGAAGAEAAEANAGEAGYEFSHWIPNRWGGPRSIFNGNYVSEEFHYMTDPFRYPSGWQEFGPKLPAAAQQILRIPWVYDGGAAGAAYGGASAMHGSSCGCDN